MSDALRAGPARTPRLESLSRDEVEALKSMGYVQ